MNTPKLAPIAIAALLSGCAMFEVPPGTQDGTTWIKVAEPLPYRWEVVPASEVAARCSFKYEHPKNACAIRLRDGPNGPYCLILSSLTAREAWSTYIYTTTGAIRTLDKKPETLWAHEMKHRNGYDHEVQK